MTTPITVQRQSFVSDKWGDRRQGTWSDLTTVNGWADTNLRKSNEAVSDRDEAENDGIVYLPAGTDVLDTDRLVISGVIYQVFGQPATIPVPYGSGQHHLETRVKRYRG